MCRAIKSLFLLLLLPICAFALNQDYKEKLNITSDTSTYNYKSTINVFEGHVIVDQGTTHLMADKLVTKQNANHKLTEAIAYGFETPAHYWTTPQVGSKVIDAYAFVIKYYPLDANIVLEKKVSILQGENSFQGELILYNMISQVIHVPSSDNGRTVLLFNPDEDKNL